MDRRRPPGAVAGAGSGRCSTTAGPASPGRVRIGGRGGTAMQAVIFNQEMARYGVSVGAFAVGIGMAGPTILRTAPTSSASATCRRCSRGDEIWCQLFSEPDGRAPTWPSIRTRAVRDGDEWVVTGQKVWTSSADRQRLGHPAGPHRSRRAQAQGHHLLPGRHGHSPGFDIRPLRQMTGSSHFSEVFLDEVRIPARPTCWATWTAVGPSPSPPCPTSGASSPAATSLRAMPPPWSSWPASAAGPADRVLRQALVDCWIRQQIQRYLGYRAQTALSQGRAARSGDLDHEAVRGRVPAPPGQRRA